MIRGLDDTTRKKEKVYVTSDGQKPPHGRELALVLKVLIARADYKNVAEGVIPFG